MAYFLQNTFTYGISGDRLLGIRNSEIYAQTARDLTNLLVSDIGSLKVAKLFSKSVMGIQGELLDVIDTIFSYYLVLTSTHLHMVNKVNKSITGSATHSYGNTARVAVLSNNKIILFNNGTEWMRTYNLTESDIQVDTNFLDVDLPIHEMEKVVVDIWKITNNPVTGEGIPKLLATVMLAGQEDFKMKLDADGTMKLFNSETKINRFYTSYRANVDATSFKDAVAGEVYAILRVNHKPNEQLKTSWVIDNTRVTLGGLSQDDVYGGTYFSNMSGGACEGVLTFGNIVDVRKPDCVAYYQNRVFLHVGDYIYASKVNELKNFRNGIANDDAFFFAPNPINNKSGKITQMVSDYGLFIVSTAGVYSLGYNGTQLTPMNFGGGLIIASDEDVRGKAKLLNGILYFYNDNLILKALMVDRGSMVLQFNTVTVDKFTSKVLFKDMAIITLEDKDYICCRSLDNNYLYMIEYVGEGLFRKTKLEQTTNPSAELIGVKSEIFNGPDVYKYGNTNYPVAKIQLNPPLMSKGGDMYIYDNKSIIRDVVLKMLNEDNMGIEGIKICGKPITNLPNPEKDIYHNYRLRNDIPISVGFEIEIKTKSNEKMVEILGVQTSIDLVPDK